MERERQRLLNVDRKDEVQSRYRQVVVDRTFGRQNCLNGLKIQRQHRYCDPRAWAGVLEDLEEGPFQERQRQQHGVDCNPGEAGVARFEEGMGRVEVRWNENYLENGIPGCHKRVVCCSRRAEGSWRGEGWWRVRGVLARWTGLWSGGARHAG